MFLAKHTLPAAALISLSAIALVMGSLWTVASDIDTAAREREETLVQRGLAGRMREAENAVSPRAMRDDAVRHLDLKYNAAWARANLGQPLGQTNGFEESYVLDAADAPIFAMMGDTPSSPAVFGRLGEATEPLLADIRMREAKRGRYPRIKPSNAIISDPIQASTIIRDGSSLFLVSATLVQPDFGAALPRPRAPVVITGEAIDAGFLGALAQRQMVDGLALASKDADLPAGAARLVLRDRVGEPVAMLAWTPHRPGARMFANAAPALLAVLLAIGALASMLILQREAVVRRAALPIRSPKAIPTEIDADALIRALREAADANGNPLIRRNA